MVETIQPGRKKQRQIRTQATRSMTNQATGNKKLDKSCHWQQEAWQIRPLATRSITNQATGNKKQRQIRPLATRSQDKSGH